ncbi:MAG TPA: efflux transporter outer membrane subunit [Rhizomicrobium sp.]|nr:efflux transporter outer membrane subunit [Rhizomicrobium sp.]
MAQSQGLGGVFPGASGLRARDVVIGVAVAVAVILAATACAPDLGTPPQIAPAGSYETARSFTAPVKGWPEEAWWKAYNDPVLDRLIDEALAGSPDLKIAEARLREADAMALNARSALFPTITGNGAVQPTRESLNQGFPKQYQVLLPHGWHTQGTITANLDYEIDFFGKNRAALAAATSDAEAAGIDVAEAQVTLSTAVASAYADLMRLSADRAAAVEIVRIRKDSAALVADRVREQLENTGQASEANSRVASAQVDVDTIDGQIAHTRDEIAALLGKGPDRGLDVALPGDIHPKAFGLPPTLAVDLIGRRPDIVAARLRTEAAASRIDEAHADYYPNIDLSAYYGVQSLDIASLLQKDSMIGQVGPAIHLPIFDGGKIESGYRNARAEYDESVATYDRTLTHALQDVADAAADCRELQIELVHARAALAESENAYRIATLRYKGGLSRYVDVLTAEDTLATLKRQVADFEAQAFAQDVALVRALGGGFVVKS